MNKFLFTKKIDSDGPEKVEFTFSPELESAIIGSLKVDHEIAILQGERKELTDGQINYVFYLPQDVCEVIKQGLLSLYTKLSGYQTSN